jgi:hypothetical protein
MRGTALVALVLATGVAVAIIALAIGPVWNNGPVSTEEATLLSTVLGAAVGAIATYLGTRGGGGPDETTST